MPDAPFDPKKTGSRANCCAFWPGAADVPDFATLDAHVADTQKRVRERFERYLKGACFCCFGGDLGLARPAQR